MTELRWKRLEGWLRDHDLGYEFTAREYADDLDMDVEDATHDIQSYLRAQRSRPDADGRRRGSRTVYVVRRIAGTRTRNARWASGQARRDARGVGSAFSSDVRTKAMDAFRPDLLRIAELSPRQAQFVELQISATVDHALELLEMAAQGMNGDES